jgi:porin
MGIRGFEAKRGMLLSLAIGFLTIASSPSWAQATQYSTEEEPLGVVGYRPFIGVVPKPPNVAGETQGYLFNLQNVGAGPGSFLAQYGIYLTGKMQNNGLAQISGGAHGEARYVGLGYFGFDVDTYKALGLPGGLFEFTASTQTGDPDTGPNGIGSTTFYPYGFGKETRLVDFNYVQSFFGHALQIQVGRMEIGYTSTPYLSPGLHKMAWYCSFFSVSCGNAPLFANDTPKAPYQMGSWGSKITVHPMKSTYLEAGVWENQPDELTSNLHNGWPGEDWNFDQARGVVVGGQGGYTTTPLTSLYPTDIHFGGIWDNGPYEDKLLDASGGLAPLIPGAPLIDHGSASLFGGIQQTVLRFSDDPLSTRGVSVFLSGDWDLVGYETQKWQYIAGFIMTGPLASRSSDTINFMASIESFDNRLTEDRDLLADLTHTPYQMGRETGFELNYGYVPAPGVTVTPFLQYVINPNELDLTKPIPESHSLAAGLRLLVNFANMLGLPSSGI